MRRLTFGAVLLVVGSTLCGSLISFGQQPGRTRVMGGPGGEAFFDYQPQAGARIIDVRIWSGEFVDSVQLVYQLPNGRTVAGPRHGGSGGTLHVIRLEGDEYILALFGRSGKYVDSLRIRTNRRTTEALGGTGGERDFRIEVPAGSRAVGLVGRSGEYLDALGLVYETYAAPRGRGGFAPGAALGGPIALTDIAGGRGGSAFADQVFPAGARIAEISIRAGEQIDAVQVIYLLPDGRFQEGPRHGGGGGEAYTFRLDSDEYIIGISGRCGEMIDSLRIHTNRRVSPVYGGGGGSRDFRINVPARSQAIGFAGRAGERIDAIGLTYMRIGSIRR